MKFYTPTHGCEQNVVRRQNDMEDDIITFNMHMKTKQHATQRDRKVETFQRAVAKYRYTSFIGIGKKID